MGVCDLWKWFDKNKLLHECKMLWNRIMKGIEILVLKGFGIIYVKSLVGECVTY
jgi:hypothetical protein